MYVMETLSFEEVTSTLLSEERRLKVANPLGKTQSDCKARKCNGASSIRGSESDISKLATVTSNDGDVTLLVVAPDGSRHDRGWVLDSGATMHICAHKACFFRGSYYAFTRFRFSCGGYRRRVVNFSIMRRMNDAWKRRNKSRLNKKYIKGKDPAKVKTTLPPFVPKEVWVEFVDMCNSDAFQAQSKKNIENHNKVKARCTTGRTSMAVVCHNLTLGKYKKGHMMAMGISITPLFVANIIHIVEENEDLKATNNELKTMLLNMRKDLDDYIKKTLGAPQIQPFLPYNATSNSSQATQELRQKQSNLNRKYKLNGCPKGIVAYGIVHDIMRDDLLSEVLEALIVIRGLVMQKTKLIRDYNRNLKDLLGSFLLESNKNKWQFIRACISGLQIHGKNVLDKYSKKHMSDNGLGAVSMVSRAVGAKKKIDTLLLSDNQETGSTSIDCDATSVDEDEDDGTSYRELVSVDRDDSNISKGCRSVCAKVCHRVVYSRMSRFFCDYGTSEDGGQLPDSNSDMDNDCYVDIQNSFKLSIPVGLRDGIAVVLEDLDVESRVLGLYSKLIPTVTSKRDFNLSKEKRVLLGEDNVLSFSVNLLQLKNAYYGRVKDHLILNKPQTLEDIKEKVNNFIDLERLITEKQKPQRIALFTNDHTGERTRNNSKDYGGDKKRFKSYDDRTRQGQKRPVPHLPQLITTIPNIYPLLQNDELFKNANTFQPIPGKPYCIHHKIHHHDTE
ncbi:hypothetical protein GIB67_017326 [Kingdonia uniflora]|uniref:Uncharacterized protein n=1 Tax=Kingdonia uniflora TaxID=39325 RepID=A0A7J7N6A8_9MAGN|nr:hypothetical protein GIB67_017326 [Kingdonia uniflora]